MTVADLLANPDRWGQGHAAMDPTGNDVDIASKDACRWCLMGAIELLYPDQFVEKCDAITACLRARGWIDGIIGYNDEPTRTYDEIMDLVREAGV